jgi:hypothetical protein
MSTNTQPAPPPSNAKEVSFSVVQMEYLQIFNQRKLVDIMNDLANEGFVEYGMYLVERSQVEEVLRKHLGIINHG